MDPWYKVATPRREVREGRSFNPDEFAIALEQVVAGTAPEDYRDPAQFFARTCFTRALRDHMGMVLRRLSGKTENTAPVLALITQFGGGKTHTLTALYHVAKAGNVAAKYDGISDVLNEASVSAIPEAKAAVFVGNAWDPQAGRETPWIDIARQLAGDKGVETLGPTALTTPPGTEAISRVFEAARAPVLLLFDEVLNYLNRHRAGAEAFHAFIQNLTVATTGSTQAACMISLPRSQVEMTDWDQQWQDRITKVVRRVAKDLIVNDEAEISEVVRRRLFQDLGNERIRKTMGRAFADWCYERRAQLPPEWTAIDAAASETKTRELLQRHFETCYPFHPATLSVFQRKWQALPQYQQTRGTLAMLAQWISSASQEAFTKARTEPLITLGSAPLGEPGFRSVALGQLGESRLVTAIEWDISGAQAHSRALDADTKGPLRDIHRRVATAILFESSGGQTEKVAHLPELRFALGEPDLDTTTIDNAAFAIEDRAYYIRKVGTDGFRIGHQPTIRRVVNDRRASLDDETEVKPAVSKLVEDEFRRGASIPIVPFPTDGAEIPDTPRLSLVIADPGIEWSGQEQQRRTFADWTRQRGASPRLYPGALLWCVKKPGRELVDKIQLMLAWRRVAAEVAQGTLGSEFDKTEKAELQSKVKDAEDAAKDQVWADYRFAVLDSKDDQDGLKVIDLGAGHSSSGETLCGRVIGALKSEALLNESVGAGYIQRNWPEAFKSSGAWPLASLRQSFLDGSLTRLVDPDTILRAKISDFVGNGDFGLASGRQSDGTFESLWFREPIAIEEVAFESGVFLLTKEAAEALGAGTPATEPPGPLPPKPVPTNGEPSTVTPTIGKATTTVRLSGAVPAEVWNRLGTKVLPKLRTGSDLKIGLDIEVTVSSNGATNLVAELRQILQELGLEGMVTIM